MTDAGPASNPTAGLQARAEIADLVHGYAHAVADGDAETCLALFVDEPSFTVKAWSGGAVAPVVQAEHHGGEAVGRFLRASIKARVIFPLVHDLLIEVEGGTARARSMMTGAGRDGVARFLGLYRDDFAWDGRWRFAARTFTLQGD